MKTTLQLGLLAVLGAFAFQACTSGDYILQQNGTGGAPQGAGGGDVLPGTGGGDVLPGTGGTPFGIGGGIQPGTGGLGIGGNGIGGNGIGGNGIGGAPSTNCGLAGTQAECDARPDCHPVFMDPGTCGCGAPGCCAHFSVCGNGAQGQCNPVPLACAIVTPYCQTPYVIAYRNNCYEGCVLQSDCAP